MTQRNCGALGSLVRQAFERFSDYAADKVGL